MSPVQAHLTPLCWLFMLTPAREWQLNKTLPGVPYEAQELEQEALLLIESRKKRRKR